MNTDKNMPCILLDREFNIISTDEQIQKKYPRLCSSDYIRSLMAGYTAEDFTEFRLINTAVLNSGKAHLAAFADGDFIRCYVLTSNISTVTERQKLINYQMREPVSSIFALLPVITDNINRGDSDKAIMYMDGIHSKSYKLLRNITNISIAEKIMDNTDFHTEKINLSSLLNSLVTSVMTVEKNVEIDFYVPTENLAIQVSMQVLDNVDTKGRETRAFVKLNNFIPDSKCILITNSEEATLDCDRIQVDVVPIWKWLLDTK